MKIARACLASLFACIAFAACCPRCRETNAPPSARIRIRAAAAIAAGKTA